MRPVAIIQARMGSSRMPGKVLRPICGRPMLWHIVRRLRCVPLLSEVVVATSDQIGDEPIRVFCGENGIAVFAGSERDVLDRFYQAAIRSGGDPLIRTTRVFRPDMHHRRLLRRHLLPPTFIAHGQTAAARNGRTPASTRQPV